MVAAIGLLLLLYWIFFFCCAKLSSLLLIFIFLQLLFDRHANPKPPLVHPFRFIRWIPPISGCFKINTDAALNCKGLKTGLKVIFRDHSGVVVLSGMSSFAGLFSPSTAEAEAKSIFFGLLMAFEGGITNLTLNSDATSIMLLLLT
ncbi:hypothetical protein ACOSP7_027607 [Xanthoceras sorbifolium]